MKKYSNEYEQFLDAEKTEVKNSTSDDKTLWNKLMCPRKFSTSWLMAMLYIILGIIDFTTLVFVIFILA